MKNHISQSEFFSERKNPSSYSKAQVIRTGIKVALSSLLLAWVIQGSSLNEVLTAMGSASVPLLLGAFSLYFVNYYVNAHRWSILLRVLGAQAPILTLMKFYITASFFNNFLPSTIGGDVVLVRESSHLLKGKSQAVVVVFLCRFLGIVALLLLALGAMMVSWDLVKRIPFLYMGISLGAFGGLIGIWMVFSAPNWLLNLVSHVQFPYLQKVQAFLQNVIKAFLAFQGRHRALILALGLAFVLQVVSIVHYYLVAQALQFSVDLHHFFLIVPIALVLIMIPVTINGIGIRENAFALLFSFYGVAQSEALAFAWITYGMVVAHGLLGGLVYAFRR